jgi:hypothetical protein
MRLVGVLAISAGVLISLTVIGIVVGWIPILAGIALFQSASKVEEAVITGKASNLTGALANLGFYFKMTAVMRLVFFGLLFLAIVGVIAIAGVFRSQPPRNEGNAIANIEGQSSASEIYDVGPEIWQPAGPCKRRTAACWIKLWGTGCRLKLRKTITSSWHPRSFQTPVTITTASQTLLCGIPAIPGRRPRAFRRHQ